MNTNFEFDGHILTEDEIEACREVLKEIRAKKEHDKLVQLARKMIGFEISYAISNIGLEETKRIVRELNRELRELKDQA